MSNVALLKPVLRVVYPLQGYECPANQTFAYGSVALGWGLTLNGQPVKPISPSGFFSVVIPLAEGPNTLYFVATSLNGIEDAHQTITVMGPTPNNPPTANSKPTVPKQEKAPIVWPQRLEDLRIVLDAGHGGDELGTIAPNGIPEKELNLTMTLAIQQALHRAGLRYVFLTRQQDKDVSLQQRDDFVKHSQAHLSLSIHHNALPDDKNPWEHQGTSIHYYHPHSLPLAQLFLENLTHSTGQPNDGVIRSSFVMTRLPHTPGLLLELGYTTHPHDAERILSPEFPNSVATGIVKALRQAVEMQYPKPSQTQNLQ